MISEIAASIKLSSSVSTPESLLFLPMCTNHSTARLVAAYILYQIAFGIRNRRAAPRAFLESVRGDLAWSVEPKEDQTDTTKKTGLYPFEGVGSERAKEWIETGMKPPGL